VAVVLDGWSVVARRSVVEAKLAGGLVGWFEVAPNRMACADRDLCLVQFMASEDASAFVMKLDELGLAGERDGAYRDVALVGKDGAWTHACSWLRIGRYAGINAVWIDGADPEPLVVPVKWQPNSIINLSNDEAAKRLKFLRRERGLEVWLDTETGKEMYRGRTGPSHAMEPEIEARFQAVAEAIKPLLTFDAPPRQLGWFERRRLNKGIRELEAIASGDRWRVWWYLGIARRSAGDSEGAFAAFEHAYTANPAHEAIGREFGGQCLALGRGDRAVTVCERTCSLHPNDAGLRANLALACVVAGDMTRAKAEVTRALAVDPSDKITRGLEKMIDDVIAGKRPRMTKYP
jgi:tetratricopeptide (TPR) repeat protein